MTVGEWLAQRTPVPPDALRERLAYRLGASGAAPIASAGEICAAAGVAVVESLIASDFSARQHAIDLLAAAALITYAIERAAESATDFASEMDALVARVAGVAGQVS